MQAQPNTEQNAAALRTLSIESLTKIYRGGTMANNMVHLSMNPGEVFGLLGPNGAGKTTLVKQIIGLLSPTKGRIRYGSIDLTRSPDRARQLCTYLPQEAVVLGTMPMFKAVELVGRIRGGSTGDVRARAERLIDRLDIAHWRNDLGSVVSGGVRRLYGFAMTAVVPGEIVILDEPTNDVDPERRRLLWKEVRRLAEEGRIVLLITHNVAEAERAVDRLGVMNDGKLIAEGTPGSLMALDGNRLRLEIVLEPGRQEPEMPEWLTKITRDGRRVHYSHVEDRAPEAIDWARSQVSSGFVEVYELGPSTLESNYLRLLSQEEDATSAEGSAR